MYVEILKNVKKMFGMKDLMHNLVLSIHVINVNKMVKFHLLLVYLNLMKRFLDLNYLHLQNNLIQILFHIELMIL